jgi:hypothetical protein
MLCVYMWSRRDLCGFVYILVEILISLAEILCGSWEIFAGVGLDKLRVLCYARLGHKNQRGLSQEPEGFITRTRGVYHKNQRGLSQEPEAFIRY